MLTGQNGIINKSLTAKIETTHSTVYETMQLEVQSYYIDKRLNATEDNLISYLQSKGIIATEEDTEGGYQINVETLLGGKQSIGNGNNKMDVYMLEEISDTASVGKVASTKDIKIASSENKEEEIEYRVTYYDTTKNSIVLGKLSDTEEITDEGAQYAYLFKIDENGRISLKGDEYSYYDNMERRSYLYSLDGQELEKIVIPKYIDGKEVTQLEQWLLTGSPLKSITIPDSVREIGYEAFKGCSMLTEVRMPGNLTGVGGSAFSNCSSLTEITIPNRVTVIGNSAFLNCSSLTEITIPDSVTTIISWAFSGCNSLQTVNYQGTESQWNSISMGSGNEALKNATINYLGK